MSELAKQKVTNVGEAFVTFNYEMHANNCFYDHRRGVIGASSAGSDASARA